MGVTSAQMHVGLVAYAVVASAEVEVEVVQLLRELEGRPISVLV